MRTELVSEPGDPAYPNEDFAGVVLPASGQGGAVVVLDGVTPPRGGTGCAHSVPWFTARLGGALTELTVSLPDVPLSEVLSAAVARTADAHRDTCDLSHPRTPQATVVLARWSAAAVEYLVLSDSALLVESPDGTVTAHLDDRLARLPRSALASAASVDAELRNKEGGFFTAAADPAVAGRAVTGTLPRSGVRSLAALTDGATRWVERFGAGDWAGLLAVVREEGAEALVSRVRDLERGEAGRGREATDAGRASEATVADRTPGAAAPGRTSGAADPGRTPEVADAARPLPLRGKTHDDATVVFVRFPPTAETAG